MAILTYRKNDLDITLEIAPATALMGMERSLLRGQADQVADEPQAARVLHRFLYPDLVACVIKAEGLEWPPTFEAFAALPDDLVARWERMCYATNPHWEPGYQDEEAAEKKQSSSGKS